MGILDRVEEELFFFKAAMRTLKYVKKLNANDNWSVADLLENVVDTHSDRIAILDETRTFTYAEFDERANRVANWALSRGVKSGDTVALVMGNRPEFAFFWFGMLKIGAVTSMLNTQIKGAALAHCINICKAKHIVVGAELSDNVASSLEDIDPVEGIWVSGGALGALGGKASDLDGELNAASTARPDASFRAGVTSTDKAFYIYTSGTTGNPKAANISHYRWAIMGGSFGCMANITKEDRMYLVMPMYHSAGGVVAVGQVLQNGGSLFIKSKLSVREFWDDCVKYDITAFQYIGELCRYLLNTPVRESEQKHRVRVAVGNGLRPEIWETFRDRFHLPEICEFYGATEGNVSLMNPYGAKGPVGAVGRIPWYMRKTINPKIVKFDIEKEEPIRGSNGYCVECKVNEVGETLGEIIVGGGASTFEGYSSKADTEKKILHNVFNEGDQWFRTGDLMKVDAKNYYYFVDRIGDTFRWKAENVATSEVAECLSVVAGVNEANVYGVKVGEMDGRAGMVALVAGEDFSLEKLEQHMGTELPSYARPVFVRMQKEIEITGTFKHRKVELVKEGFNPEIVSDPLFFLNPETEHYQPLNSDEYNKIISGDYRL